MSRPINYQSSDDPASATRRAFLTEMGLGFGGVALSAMLARDGFAAFSPNRPNGSPHIASKAKSVIWLFMIGGVSQHETFDPKPALNEYAGKNISESPWKDVLTSPYLAHERRTNRTDPAQFRQTILPLQVGYRKHGQSGLEISDWWPHLAKSADDLCLVRSMYTEDSNHTAQLQFHTGRHSFDGFFPTIGSWASYGLGTLNENLPQFVVLGAPVAECCGGVETHRGNYLGPRYDAVPLVVDPQQPIPYAVPVAGTYREEQQAQFALIHRLNESAAARTADNAALQARIRSYELAFRMQAAVPEVVNFGDETSHTRELYGLDLDETKSFGSQMLTARRLVERGVRFVQVYHGGGKGQSGMWDAHANLKKAHANVCREVDQPIAALLQDLKQRGLLDETLVVWASEFGRTPGSQGNGGRDHHPYGFTVWMAGGGIKGGLAHGATDELGFHAVEHRHYVTDIHATVLHQLGLDPRRLTIPGRKRLAKDFGEPIREIMA